MGKTLHKDEKQNKLTFVSLYGLENARRIAAELDGRRARRRRRLRQPRPESAKPGLLYY